MRGTLSDQFRGQRPFFWVVVIAAGYAAVALTFHCVLLYKYAGMEKLGYPLVFQLRAIELKAQPLGFLKRVDVPTATLQLQAGEALIWLSDGFEERMNARNEEWGAEQVAAALTEICTRETAGAAIARELIAACDRASDGRGNDDDMTIVVVRVMSGSA